MYVHVGKKKFDCFRGTAWQGMVASLRLKERSASQFSQTAGQPPEFICQWVQPSPAYLYSLHFLI